MVMTTDSKPKAGLEDTVATSSAICYLDGDRGVLAYCGFELPFVFNPDITRPQLDTLADAFARGIEQL